jgi:hypothetical protein
LKRISDLEPASAIAGTLWTIGKRLKGCVRRCFACPAVTWLAWLVPVFAWAPLAYPGYFEFLDGYSPIFNLNDLIRHGLSTSWVPSIGQPYDLWRGERILPYLLAALAHAVGFSDVASIKLVLFAAILGGSLGMYAWARRRLGAWPGLLAAVVYAFWPLGLATIYVRGAFAEAAFLGILPWVWWAAEVAGAMGTGPASAGLALALAACFWTQPGLALWLAAGLLAFLLFEGHSSRSVATLAGWLAGVALGLAGLVPGWIAHGLGGQTYVTFSDHFVYLYQLLQAGWGSAPGATGPYDAMPLQLGVVTYGLALLGVVLAPGFVPVRDGKEGKPEEGKRGVWAFSPESAFPVRARLYLAGALVLVPIALSLTWAAALWRALPFLERTLTYPWQLLLLTGPWLAWLAGMGGLALLERISATVPAEVLPDLDPLVEPAAPASDEDVDGEREPQAPGADKATAWAVPLFAGLMVLALLGVYGDLDPPATPVRVPDQPVAVFGDNQIALVSAVMSDTLASGPRASVRVQWQALRPLDQDYTVFFHAETADGTVCGQADTMPHNNKAPTSGWRPGAVISDTYTLALKPGAPSAVSYRYLLGLYQYQTGARLSDGADNQVVLNER